MSESFDNNKLSDRLNLGGKDMVLVSGFDELKSIHSSEFSEDRGDMI